MSETALLFFSGKLSQPDHPVIITCLSCFALLKMLNIVPLRWGKTVTNQY
jgi:hypothetical protein